MTAMEQSNTELKGKVAEQDETILSQQEALSAKQQQQVQQQQQPGGYSDEDKLKYENQFGMNWEQIIGTQSLINSGMQNAMKPIIDRENARDLRETQRDIKTNDVRFKFVEANVSKRFNALPPEQKNSEVYINLVRQVKEENLEGIIESEVTSRMNTNKGLPPTGNPAIGAGGGNPPPVNENTNDIKLTPRQIMECKRRGVDPAKAEKEVNSDFKKIHGEVI
jgi:hypothetical protein